MHRSSAKGRRCYWRPTEVGFLELAPGLSTGSSRAVHLCSTSHSVTQLSFSDCHAAFEPPPIRRNRWNRRGSCCIALRRDSLGFLPSVPTSVHSTGDDLACSDCANVHRMRPPVTAGCQTLLELDRADTVKKTLWHPGSRARRAAAAYPKAVAQSHYRSAPRRATLTMSRRMTAPRSETSKLAGLKLF